MNSGERYIESYDTLTSTYVQIPHIPVLDFPAPKDDRSLEETNFINKNRFKHKKKIVSLQSQKL